MKRILVAGIGNIFLGDDGFGCEVAQRLARMELPADVDVVDFGIRGIDLGYALMDGYDSAILIDAVERDGEPGTVYVIAPELDDMSPEAGEADGGMLVPHAMEPSRVLRFVATLGDRRPRVLLVGCQPETLGGEEGCMGLSAVVSASIQRAVEEVQALLRELSGDDAHTTPTHGSAIAPGDMT